MARGHSRSATLRASLTWPFQSARLFHSSWGYRGYSEVWLNSSNHYVYPHLHRAARRMPELAKAHPHAEGLRLRALNQAARELLLAQASDWAFIMKTGTMVEYAQRRTEAHIGRFNRLHDDLLGDRLDPDWLGEIESRDNLFPEIDFRVYSTVTLFARLRGWSTSAPRVSMGTAAAPGSTCGSCRRRRPLWRGRTVTGTRGPARDRRHR